MRQLGLFFFAIGLFSFLGAMAHVLGVQLWLPDPGLILVVFVGLRCSTNGGLLQVCLLGLLSDSFGRLPFGFSQVSYLIIWSLVRWASGFVLGTRNRTKIGIMFLMSLAHHMIMVGLLLLLEFGHGLEVVVLQIMFPLAFLHLLLATPVWKGAEWILGISSREQWVKG